MNNEIYSPKNTSRLNWLLNPFDWATSFPKESYLRFSIGRCSIAVRALAVLLGLISFGLGLEIHAATSPAEQNWPAWRGPHMNGVAPQANPPVSWSETENIKWKRKLPGSGSSTPIVWDQQIFVTAAVPTGKKLQPPPKGDEPTASGQEDRSSRRRGPSAETPNELYQFIVLCLHRQTGDIQWQRIAREEAPHEGHHRDHGYASYSPVTDGQVLLAYFGSRGLHAYDLQGNLQWQKDLGKMQTRMSFGEGSSPALSGNTVVVNWDHQGEDFIVALDKNTGQELWRQPRQEDTSWATPFIVEHDGKKQVITSATAKIRSYDLETGKLIWESEGMTGNVIPTPVAQDGIVYAMSGFRGNALLAIRLGKTGDLTGSDAIVWRHNKNTPYVPSPLLYGNRLYFFSGNSAMLSCFHVSSGRPLIDAERIEGMQGVYASPVGASGRVYLTGRNGVSVVIKNSDTLEVLATNRLDDGFDASPALVDRELFLRGHQSLYCIAER